MNIWTNIILIDFDIWHLRLTTPFYGIYVIFTATHFLCQVNNNSCIYSAVRVTICQPRVRTNIILDELWHFINLLCCHRLFLYQNYFCARYFGLYWLTFVSNDIKSCVSFSKYRPGQAKFELTKHHYKLKHMQTYKLPFN